LQEIHLALWRSLRLFDGRCSLQTWVYRVAHNVGASYILRERRTARRLLDLEAFEQAPGLVDGEAQANRQLSVSQLLE
jgi:RNA polymerase sigma-70 factor (ECF subfamily)